MRVVVVNAVAVAVDYVFGELRIDVVSVEVVVNSSPLGRDPVSTGIIVTVNGVAIRIVINEAVASGWSLFVAQNCGIYLPLG